MEPKEIAELEEMISKPRLLSYSLITGNTNTEGLIGAYDWNKQISASIYPILQCLEVTLRNSLNKNIANHTQMSDWYTYVLKKGGDKKFIKERAGNLNLEAKFFRKGVTDGKRGERERWTSHHESMLNNARSTLISDQKKCTSNAMIAELTFGFWVKLFEQSYRGTDKSTSLWPHLEKEVFPNMKSKQRDSSVIFQKLNELKKLRNRMSHHEPIWKSSSVKCKKDALNYLNNIVDDAISIIGGISKQRHESLLKSGKVLKFKGLCSIDVLDSFIHHNREKRMDKRKFAHNILKIVKNDISQPVVININDVPKLIVGLY